MSALQPDLAKARRFLEAKGPSHPLIVGVTGSHFYGFPSPDSDLDLKGIHSVPTAQMAGLAPPTDAIEFLGDFEETELDFTSQELGFALRLLLRGNGNVLERVLSPYQVIDSSTARELRNLARDAVSRRFFGHYRGFFGRQRQMIQKEGRPTAKLLLYAYRSALTGIHLLRTGECVGDVVVLADRYGFPGVPELVVEKREGTEHGVANDAAPHLLVLDQLDRALAAAHEESPLAEQAPNTDRVSSFLVNQRRAHFD